MKISFVIPTFNEGKYIEDCLSSIFALHLHVDFEVIVADNQSSDRTVDIVKTKFPNVKLVDVSDGKGPAAARNGGARIATGECLAFIDADCRIPQGWWDEVVKGFRNPRVVLVYGPYRYYELRHWHEKVFYFISNFFGFGISEIIFRKILRLGGPASGGDTIVRRVAFERIGGFNSSFDFYGEDIDLNKRIMEEGRVRYLPATWVYSSKRRLEKEGTLKMWMIYMVNTLGIIFFNKVLITRHKVIR